MDKEKKNRSGNISGGSRTQDAGHKGREHLPGAPSESNRQTGGSNRNERDDSDQGPGKNTTKKGENAV